MNNPLFSIVVPTFNRADLILKTLNTVFNQSYKNFEIIVVDNGSTDNTIEVLQPLIQQNKIRFVKNKINKERSFSRNRGMEEAKGDFLTLLDSDDLMYKNALADAANFIKLNPQSHFFHNLYHLVNQNGDIIYKYRFPSAKRAVKGIANGNFLSCIGVFLSKEIYTKYRFETNPVILGSEDWEFWIQILANYPLGRIKKINHAIVHHEGRSITAFSLESIIKRKKFIVDQVQFNPNLNKIYHRYIKNINTSANLFAASIANSAGLYHEAKKYIRLALKNNFFVIFNLKFIRALQIATLHKKHKHKI